MEGEAADVDLADLAVQGVVGALAQLGAVLADGGQGGTDGGTDGQVVDAQDAHVLRHPQAHGPAAAHHLQGQQVVVQSKDSFYGQHSPARMPTAAALAEKWEAWRRLGVLASEMEAAALFTVGAARGLRTGAVFHVIWNQERAAAGLDTDADESHDTSAAVRAAVEAIRRLSEKPD